MKVNEYSNILMDISTFVYLNTSIIMWPNKNVFQILISFLNIYFFTFDLYLAFHGLLYFNVTSLVKALLNWIS